MVCKTSAKGGIKKNLIGLLDDFQSSIFQNRKGRFLVVCTDGISILS